MTDPQLHGTEIRRCLVEMDVAGLMKIWRHVAPHLADQTPAQTLISAHMARVEMKFISLKLKTYSKDWLAERGIAKVDGVWVDGLSPQPVIASAVGIASKSKYPGVSKRIVRAMSDALNNGRAKGVVEPEMQRELMLKARAKERSKMAMV